MTDLTPRQQDVSDIIDDHDGAVAPHVIADELGVITSTVRDHARALEDVEYDASVSQYVREGTDVDPEADDVKPDDSARVEFEAEQLVHPLQHGGLTFTEAGDRYGISEHVFRNRLDELRLSGYTIDFKELDAEGTRRWFIPEERDKRFRVGDGDGRYKFGVISDTHLGSAAEHLEELHDYYDRVAADPDIEYVFHAGDISDGWKVHKGHTEALKGEATGWKRLREYVIEHYPRREGITTIFIEGNHDHKLKRRTGISLGKQIAAEREDLIYAGDSQARFVFDPEHDIDLELIHPSGGQPYTVGYRLQTLYRERPASERPTIAVIGHLHGSMFAKAEGVLGFYAGCWKGITTYGKRKGHSTEIGGWILTLEVEAGEVRRLTPDWISYEPMDASNTHDMQDLAELQ
ncbi:metallophosphoesterase [Halomarina rubra]|uniref:Metallophosphoesterase n=1 Tax=Halomarina rubra TaxID=2071873 RepID=A0ABD6B0V8_9EURY|nr:metallophosphoesterase [Halomarina rubra]